MKIKMWDVFNSKDILEKVGTTKLEDGVTIHHLIKNIRAVEKHYNEFEQARAILVKNLGKEKQGGGFEVKSENMDEYTRELNKMLEEEVEIAISLLNPEKIKGFSAFEIMPIEWMFEEPKEG